jgi:hypothetical protein
MYPKIYERKETILGKLRMKYIENADKNRGNRETSLNEEKKREKGEVASEK